ncbi:MAG: glutathione S-transferase family protein [Candidatus Methylomirabilis sp.]|nr:glutathione S-transferase family protein [Deltaproteobacteria bacterium]
MKIYGFQNSPNDRRARAVAYHLGLDFEYEEVDLMSGAQKKPEFLKINPTGRIPALVDGDFTLWECVAIMQYLGSKKDSPLWPRDDRARADITRWQAWTLAHWGAAAGTIIYERVIKAWRGQGGPDAARVKEGEDRFHPEASALNDQLRGREWITGKNVTLADFMVAGTLTYGIPAQLPLEGYPEIRRWYAGVEKLDAWKRTIPPILKG